MRNKLVGLSNSLGSTIRPVFLCSDKPGQDLLHSSRQSYGNSNRIPIPFELQSYLSSFVVGCQRILQAKRSILTLALQKSILTVMDCDTISNNSSTFGLL